MIDGNLKSIMTISLDKPFFNARINKNEPNLIAHTATHPPKEVKQLLSELRGGPDHENSLDGQLLDIRMLHVLLRWKTRGRRTSADHASG